jgi:hypothetical protein
MLDTKYLDIELLDVKYLDINGVNDTESQSH